MTYKDEASQAARFLASLPIGTTTLDTEALRELLLSTGGTLMSCGYLRAIKATHLGAGVYDVRLAALNS